jgi:hypothetical protein
MSNDPLLEVVVRRKAAQSAAPLQPGPNSVKPRNVRLSEPAEYETLSELMFAYLLSNLRDQDCVNCWANYNWPWLGHFLYLVQQRNSRRSIALCKLSKEGRRRVLFAPAWCHLDPAMQPGGNRMIVLRYSILILVAVCINAHTVMAAEDDWKAERKAAESEPPAICASFAALVRGEIAKARVIKAALKSSETGAPTSVLEAAQRMMGNKHETDWQREQKRLLEKARTEAFALNARYSDQLCGSIDVDQEIASEAAPQESYVPLKSKTPKTRF